MGSETGGKKREASDQKYCFAFPAVLVATAGFTADHIREGEGEKYTAVWIESICC